MAPRMSHAERAERAEFVDLVRRAMAGRETEARAALYHWRQLAGTDCVEVPKIDPDECRARLEQVERDRSRLDADAEDLLDAELLNLGRRYLERLTLDEARTFSAELLRRDPD